MSEREEAGQRQRHCPNCGAEVRLENAFCVSCGERLSPEVANAHEASTGLSQGNLATDGTPRMGKKDLSAALSQLAQDAYQQSKKAYEGTRARYRGRREFRAAEQKRNEILRAVEREREARRSRFYCYRKFFERAYSGSETSLNWWRAYHDKGPDGGQPSISDLLRSALERAKVGLRKMREIEEPLAALLREDSFGEADRLLDDVRVSQENLDGEESVFPPLVVVHDGIKQLNGWTNYKEELERFIKDLEDLLGSPNVQTAATNRLRFPDIGRVSLADLERAHTPNHTAKRPKLVSPAGGSGGSVRSNGMSRDTAVGMALFVGLLALTALLAIGLLVLGLLVIAADQVSCIGCGGTDPKDKSYVETLKSGLEAGTSDADERIKIEDVSVNGSSATVTLSDDVTDAEARYVCNYALDFSRGFSRSGGGSAKSLLEAQVKRPGLFNDTKCER